MINIEELKPLNPDKIMNDSFWIELYPGMGDEAIGYMIEKIREFCGNIK